MIRVKSIFQLCGLSGRYCLFDIAESAKMMSLIPNGDAGPPSLAKLVPPYPDVTAGIVGSHSAISRVLKRRNRPQIAKPIVGSDAVDMIQLLLRECPMRPQPSYAMCGPHFSSEPPAIITSFPNIRECRFARKTRIPHFLETSSREMLRRSRQPSQFTRLRVVGNALTKIVDGEKSSISHVACPRGVVRAGRCSKQRTGPQLTKKAGAYQYG